MSTKMMTHSMAASDAPTPNCPFCKHSIDPRTDILWDHTPLTAMGGVTVTYCGWCGAILGSADHQMFVHKHRD